VASDGLSAYRTYCRALLPNRHTDSCRRTRPRCSRPPPAAWSPDRKTTKVSWRLSPVCCSVTSPKRRISAR